MYEISPARVPTRAEIDALQRELSTLPQATLTTEHHFVPAPIGGFLYIRKMALPKGFRGVGKAHKHPHFFVLLAGTMRVWTDASVETFTGDVVVKAPAGVKRVLLCLTDCVGMNVHHVSTDNLADIEKELVEDDASALFGPGNILRSLAIEHSGEPTC